MNGLVVIPLVAFAAWRLALVLVAWLDAADDLRPLERRRQERAALGRATDRANSMKWEDWT